MGIITRLLLLICCGLFFMNQFLASKIETPPHFPVLTPFTTKIEKNLSYDYPYQYQLISQFIQTYGYEGFQNPQELPREGKFLLRKIKETPVWPGIYSLIQQKGIKAIPNAMKTIPMFEKIQQGQGWRLFTPCLLHADIFHLFFNMLWLIVLGKQIEQRLKIGRYLVFILLTGIFSNTFQYLAGGPNFIGFSGILCAMLAFIWVRQRQTPWEGYQLDRMTMLFIMLFIVSMALLQLFFFFIETATEEAISSGIANTAHLSGALIGYVLGRFNFFSWRHS
jgi:GlpG protein